MKPIKEKEEKPSKKHVVGAGQGVKLPALTGAERKQQVRNISVRA